jgi:tripartite-type tricarboxylate transporter receptor subunit TctC
MVMSPEAFDKYTREDIAKWADVIKAAHITVD